MIQQKLKLDQHSGRFMFIGTEGSKNSSSDSSDEDNTEKDVRNTKSTFYTSTSVLQPNHQRLSEIMTKRETIADINNNSSKRGILRMNVMGTVTIIS
jgi:hypothetical protein